MTMTAALRGRLALIAHFGAFAASTTLGLGCATGGKDGGDNQPVDAASPDTSIVADGPLLIDAPTTPIDAPPDASTSTPPDAGGGLFCAENNQCTAGECCLTLGGDMGFCTPGTVFLGECFPFE